MIKTCVARLHNAARLWCFLGSNRNFGHTWFIPEINGLLHLTSTLHVCIDQSLIDASRVIVSRWTWVDSHSVPFAETIIRMKSLMLRIVILVSILVDGVWYDHDCFDVRVTIFWKGSVARLVRQRTRGLRFDIYHMKVLKLLWAFAWFKACLSVLIGVDLSVAQNLNSVLDVFLIFSCSGSMDHLGFQFGRLYWLLALCILIRAGRLGWE